MFLLEAVQLAVVVGYVLANFIGLGYSGVGVLTPDVEDGHQDVLAEVAESSLGVHLGGRTVIAGGGIVHRVVVQADVLTALFPLFDDRLTLVDLFLVGITFPLELVQLVGISMFYQLIIVGVAVIAALQRVRMDDAELFVQHYSTASLLIHVLEPIFCLHVLPGEVALLELEVYAVVAQQLRE